MLTFRFQKELAMKKDATASAVHHNVTDTDTVVSDVRDDIASTSTIVSGTHYGALKRSQGQTVSTIHTLPVVE